MGREINLEAGNHLNLRDAVALSHSYFLMLKAAFEQSINQEAESVADKLWGLEEGLSSTDPALVREVFRRLVEKIECRWEPVPNGGDGKCQTYRLTGGVVYLRDPLVAVTCACHAKA
jgi:hypothetical protein